MKKHLIFNILSLIFIISSLPAQAIKRITANPINIASRLILQPDSAEVAATLEYYGYTLQSQSPLKPETLTPETSGSAIFTHPDGSTITVTFPTHSSHPTIQVYTKTSKPQIEKILYELDYKKVGNHYEAPTSKYSTYLTQCTIGSGNAVIFTRQKKKD